MNPLPARLWGKLLEPKTQVEPSRQPFSNQDLKQLIVPLFVEQLLAMLVGIADTLMVSYAGEAAVSGGSLVNMLNTFFIFLFTALASGGAVVVSQYIGSKDGANSNLAAGQLYTLAFLFSLVCMAATLVWNRPLLGLLFGQVEPDVMEASAIYLRISAYSYPFLALYNAGAALYRCMSKTKVTMQISLVMNAINVAGNAIGIFVLHAGVAGVAWPSTLSRAFAAVAMTALCFSQKNQVRLLWKDLLTWNSSMVRRLLRIAVPNSIENGLFQLAKVALSSITAMFGTVQIAANGVAQSIWSLAALVGSAMGPAFITVVGQCMGASDTEAAGYYMRKLTRLALSVSIAWNALVLLLTPVMLLFYDLSPGQKPGVLAGGHPQHLQRRGLSHLRALLQRPAGRRGREVHHVHLPVLHHCGAGGAVHCAGCVDGPGRYRHCPGHGRGLVRESGHLAAALQSRQVEDLPGAGVRVAIPPRHGYTKKRRSGRPLGRPFCQEMVRCVFKSRGPWPWRTSTASTSRTPRTCSPGG